MSKAFIKEDTQEEQELDDNDAPTLPAGTKNYITPSGLGRLQEELRQLKNVERPAVTKVVSWAAENGDRSENADYIYGKKRLREIDRRIRFLAKRLDHVEVVDPTDPTRQGCKQVFFGATVRIAFDDGTEKQYSIVGVDEVEADQGKISWVSPIGAALLLANEGDFVTFRSPRGPREIEILEVLYRAIP